MYRWRRASVSKFSWVRGHTSPQEPEHREEPFHATISGFHHNATLTLSPRLTTAVVATIAASTLSLGVSVTIVMVSFRAIMSIPA
ncbi:hypothetical protein LQG66_31175 [Bradyrhizobium ontarionense]|uniref:Uncharacterized protein n=1 Tax=Bradyrhizobium ontarionense TaxID=2898149 RepID=A0ABY3RA34_9BRAD|nr:hypothetical protein [Bradyrhizobium sp. A19]UFZ03633.1 hypothetical protein LQG66_31175 [Bradyrhizobium sp. A19]